MWIYDARSLCSANSANSRRVETPVLSKMLLKWCLTVSSLREHFWAITLLEQPAATRPTSSRSRTVRPNGLFSAARDRSAPGRPSASTRSPITSRSTQYSPDCTARIALSSRPIADSFATTPRTPSFKARGISARCSAAVSRMMRVVVPASCSWRATSRPDCPGIATSSNTMSGCSFPISAITSGPLPASPTTRSSGSASRSRRNPSRNIAWSSARRMRTGGATLGDGITCRERNPNLEAGASPRPGVDRQLTAESPDAFLDDSRPLERSVQIVERETPTERKASAIVADLNHALMARRLQPQLCGVRPAMTPDVGQRLLNETNDFSTRVRVEVELLHVAGEGERDPGLAAKPLDQTLDMLQQLSGVDLRGTKLLRQLAKGRDLVVESFLDQGEVTRRC